MMMMSMYLGKAKRARRRERGKQRAWDAVLRWLKNEEAKLLRLSTNVMLTPSLYDIVVEQRPIPVRVGVLGFGLTDLKRVLQEQILRASEDLTFDSRPKTATELMNEQSIERVND